MRHLVLLTTVFLAGAYCCVGPASAGTSPLTPGEHTARLNGLELWYLVGGNGPVCLVPSTGWGPSSDMYFRAFGPLEDVFTLVYLDSRGSGRSELPADSAAYAYADFVADLEALRQHLGQEKIWLLGQSEGGVQVQHYAVAHGDRVAGLVLVDTLPASDAEWLAEVHARVEARKGEPYYEAAAPIMVATFAGDEKGWKGFDTERLGMSFPEMWELTMPFYMSDFRRLEEINKRMMSQGSRQEVPPPPEGFSAAALQGMKHSGRHPFNLVEQLKHVQAPTLIVVGADDVVASPATAERLHLALPNSKLLLIQDARHFPWVEQPETFFGGIKRFLQAVGQGTCVERS